MTELKDIAEPFVNMAHSIVWASAATVDRKKRPRSRVLHPIWQWDGEQLVGYIGTSATKTKRAHLEESPFISLNYWATNQDTCTAECHATWAFDDETCTRIWNLFKETPMPIGYDPAIIPSWNKPTDDAFVVLKLDPWKLRVFPGTLLMGQGGEELNWQQ